jgi:hypothetical protein
MLLLGLLSAAFPEEFRRKDRSSKRRRTGRRYGRVRDSRSTRYDDLALTDVVAHDSTLATEPITAGPVEPEPVDPEAAQIGDTITYAFLDDRSREITITLRENDYVVAKGIQPRHHPLSEVFLRVQEGRGVRAGDTISLPAGGRMRRATVVRITKGSCNQG